jgi:hypothetical protein
MPKLFALMKSKVSSASAKMDSMVTELHVPTLTNVSKIPKLVQKMPLAQIHPVATLVPVTPDTSPMDSSVESKRDAKTLTNAKPRSMIASKELPAKIQMADINAHVLKDMKATVSHVQMLTSAQLVPTVTRTLFA